MNSADDGDWLEMLSARLSNLKHALAYAFVRQEIRATADR